MTSAAKVDRCDLGELRARDLAEGWREVFLRIYIPLDAQPAPITGEHFHATALRRRLDDLSLVDLRCGRGTARRAKHEIAATDGDLLGFMMMRSGRSGFTHDGRSIILTPGQATFWDGAKRGSFTNLSPSVQRTLVIPRERMRSVMPNYETAVARLHPANPSVRLVTRYLETVASLATELDDATRLAAADAAIELVRVALGATSSERPQALRLAVLTAARRYIEDHLSDPDLTPASIARAHAVSVRTLHEIFESGGETVGATIRRQRLRRCYSDLTQSTADHVLAIALRWGFRSASHFSRTFRAEFGVSPSEVRPHR